MSTIYWSSVVIGLVIGLCAGIALSLWATWSTDKEIYNSLGSDWSRGYDKGYESGVNAQKIEEAIHRPIKQEGVRCKDCKKYGDNKKCPIEALINSDSKQFFAFDENWFCADGERKEGR